MTGGTGGTSGTGGTGGERTGGTKGTGARPAGHHPTLHERRALKNQARGNECLPFQNFRRGRELTIFSVSIETVTTFRIRSTM